MRGFGLVIALAVLAEAEELTNSGDSWVRENGPGSSFAGDLISVWNTVGGDRRYGVVSFDLTALTEPVTEVSLSLWSAAFGFSDDAVPMKQTAIAIDPDGIDSDSATWDQVDAATTLHTFEGLGGLEIGAPASDAALDGVFIDSMGTAADVEFVESVRTGAGTLMVVLIADEADGESHRASWGDGEFNGEDALLTTNSDVEVSDDPSLVVEGTLAFGVVNQGEGPFIQNLTIGNTGAVEILNISTASFDGPNAAQFGVPDGTFPLQINPGESAEVEITFAPGVAGFFEATLELASDDPSDGIVLIALTGTSEAPSTAVTVTNNGDSWVRESGPDAAFPADLISVWSASSSDGARRYGVLSFDLSSLTEPVGGVSLSLWSAIHGFSDDAIPLKQTAIAIDPAGIDPDAATWNQVAAASVLHTFESLGAYDIAATNSDPALQDVFLESAGSAADAAFVDSVRAGSGALMIVMISDPEGTNFSNSWGDGELNGEDAFLSIEPGTRLQIQVGYDEGSDEFSISWESKMGLLYNVRSETDLSIDPGTWPIFDNLESIPADPSGTTIVTFPLPGDADRFFVVEQFPAPPVSVFSESFDEAGPDLPADWTTGTGPGDTGTTVWELGVPAVVGPPAAKSAPNCVGTNLSADYGLDSDILLRTPPIDLTTASSATLSFQQFTDIEEGFDFGTVSLLDADDDSELAVLLDAIDGVTADWSKVTRPIPPAALGHTIKIEFRFQADDVSSFAGWYLDDLEVTVP